MKSFSFLHGSLLFLVCAVTAQAVCPSNLLIDDYSHFANNMNSLGRYTSDDGTTKDLMVDVVNKKIKFSATKGSYLYTNFDCEAATVLGYDAVTFPIKSSCGASFELELQTSRDCTIVAAMPYTYMVPTKMTGGMIVLTVPLHHFLGANLNAINSLVFGGLAPGIWEIGATQLVCINGQSNSVNGSTTSVSAYSCVTPVAASPTTMTSTINITTSSSTSTAASSAAPNLSPSPRSTSATSGNSTASVISATSTIHANSAATSVKTTTSSTPASSCTNLLIDDFASASRLLSQHVNALLQPSCDDGTMRSVTVANKHATLIPIDTKSYFYTSFRCLQTTNVYGGITIAISAPVHTVLTLQIKTSSGSCQLGNPTVTVVVSSKELGWTFDGTERAYVIPFAMFSGLDTNHLVSLRLLGFRNTLALGHVEFYCKVPEAHGF